MASTSFELGLYSNPVESAILGNRCEKAGALAKFYGAWDLACFIIRIPRVTCASRAWRTSNASGFQA